MKLYLLGDWAQAQSFITGLKIQEGLLSWLFIDNRWVLGIALVCVFSFAVYTFLKEKKFGAFASTVILFTLYVGVLGKIVPVTIHTPAMSSSMESSIAQGELRVSQASAALEAAQNQPGQPNIMTAQDTLSYATNDLAKLKKLDLGVGAEVAKANVLFAFYYTFVDVVFLSAWEVFDSVDQSISVKQRGIQAGISEFMANDPQLNSDEKSMVGAYSECLIKKQTYLDQLQQIGQNVAGGIQVNDSQNPPLVGEDLANAWAEIIYPSREEMDAVCQTLTGNFGKTVDAGISQADIENFKGGYTVFGHTFFADNQGKYLAKTLGLPAEKLVGMSDDEIAKTFYRAKKMEAMGKELKNKMSDISGSTAGVGLLEKSGIKASVGGFFSEWLGGFMLSVKPFLQDSINFIFYLLPIAFFFTVLASFIPKYHWKAHQMFISAFIFVFAWQFTVLVVEKHAAYIEQSSVGVMSSGDGVGEYVSNFVTGSWDQITGASVVDAGAGAAVTTKVAATKVGQAAIAKILVAAKLHPITAVVSTVGSASYAVGSAGYNAVVKMDKENAEFNKLLMEEGKIDPGFVAIADGALSAQRTQIEAAKSRASMNEALWLLASPMLAMFLAFGSWFGLGSVGQMAGQAASSVGGSVASVATQGFGRGGVK